MPIKMLSHIMHPCKKRLYIFLKRKRKSGIVLFGSQYGKDGTDDEIGKLFSL